MVSEQRKQLNQRKELAMAEPIEGKVYAGTIGAGAGATISAFLLWLLGVTVWHAPNGAETATAAVAAVPGPVAGIVALVVTVGGAFLGGYMAKHTSRPAPVLDPPHSMVISNTPVADTLARQVDVYTDE